MAIGITDHTGPYTANGSQTAFPFDFTAMSDGEVVVQVDGATISSTLYTVARTDTGGTVTFLTAPASGASVLILSQPDFAQLSTFENQGAYNLSTVNAINRRDAVKAAWLKSKVSRSLLVPMGENGLVLPGASTRAGKVAVFTDAGSGAGLGVVDLTASQLAGLAGQDVAIGILAANITSLLAVNADLVNLNAVAGDLTNLNLVAGSLSNVNSVAGGLTNINAVAGGLANINTVAGSIGNVNAVGAGIGNVGTVAGSMANVNTVATDLNLGATSKIKAVYDNISAVVAVGTDLLLGAASKIAIVAADLALGAASLIGKAPQAALDAAASAASAAASASQFLVTKGPTGFSLTDTNGYRWLHATLTDIKHAAIDLIKSRLAVLEAYAAKMPLIGAQGPASWALTDSNGYNWFRATPKTLQHPVIDSQARNISAALRGAPDPTLVDMRVMGDIIGINFSGESRAGGHGSTPPISTTTSTYADMFGNAGLTSSSIVPDDIADISSSSDPDLTANRAAITAAFETTKAPDADDWTSHGETPNTGCAQMIVQLLKDEDGIDFAASGQRMLLVNDFRNGSAIQAEMNADPALTYARVAASFNQAAAIYAAAGKSWAPAASNLIIGANDLYLDATEYPTPTTKYFYNLAVTLQQQRQTLMQSVCGGTRRLPMLISQVPYHTRSDLNLARPNVALDQLQLALDHQEFILACIDYAVENQPNDVHHTNKGTKHMGAYFGWALKRLLFDGIRMTPLMPVFHAQGSRIIATFPVNRSHKIVGGVTASDTTVLANWGVTAVTAGGTAMALSNPRVVSRDQVIWDAPSTPADTWLFRCGWSGAVPGNSNKGFTNIAEARVDGSGAAAPLIFDPGYLRLPMYRWLPICEVPLS